MNPEIISEKPVTMAEIKDRLDASKKEAELSFRAQKTHDYLVQNTLISKGKKAIEAVKKVTELEIPRLKDTHITKIVDTLPVSVEELKSVLNAYPLTVTNDNLKKIVDTLDEFRK